MAEELVKGNLQNWTSKKEVAASFGVGVRTIERILKELNSDRDVAVQFAVSEHSKKVREGRSFVVYYDDELINKIGLQLKKNAISQGEMESLLDTNKNWTAKKDLAEMLGVDTKTLERVIEELTKDNGVLTQNHIKKGGYHNSQVYYDDELVKMIGMQLKKNAISQGRQSEVVKQSNYEDIEVGMAANAVMKSGSIQAAEEFAKLLISRTQAVADLQLLQQKNEQLEHALEYDKVAGWKPWNHLKKEIQYKGNFQKLVDAIPLVEEEDYSKKVMGDDCYPTTLISLTGEEKIIDYKETVLDEK